MATATKSSVALERPMYCYKHGIVYHRIYKNPDEPVHPYYIVIYSQCTFCYTKEDVHIENMNKNEMSLANFSAFMNRDYY